MVLRGYKIQGTEIPTMKPLTDKPAAETAE